MTPLRCFRRSLYTKDASGSCSHQRWMLALLVLGLGWLCGCSATSGYIPPSRLLYRDLSVLYYQTPLQQSSSLDVQRRMKGAQGTVDAKYVELEVITPSDGVIASSGRSHKGTKSWFTLVAFDKYSNTAQRKYFFYMDENASKPPLGSKNYLIPARTVLVFDVEAMVGEVLVSPHASEQARKVAVVNFLATQLQRDIKQLGGDDAQMANADIVGVNGMFMNQVFRDAINEIRKYPVLTRELHISPGVAFESMSLADGRIQLVLDGDRATARIEMGYPADK